MRSAYLGIRLNSFHEVIAVFFKLKSFTGRDWEGETSVYSWVCKTIAESM